MATALWQHFGSALVFGKDLKDEVTFDMTRTAFEN